MTTKPAVLVVGAGPAGMSCALWLHHLGAHPVLLDTAAEAGGLVRGNYHPNDWLLGFDHATGTDLAGRFERHVRLRNIAIFTHTQCIEVRGRRGEWQLLLEREGRRWPLVAAALVVATGTAPRSLPFLRDLQHACPQRIISSPTDRRLRDVLLGQQIAVLGGGDNAFENALVLADNNLRIDLFYRGEARARLEFRQQAAAHERIGLHPQCFPSGWEITPDGVVRRDLGVRYDTLCALLGFAANTHWLMACGLSAVSCNTQGHVEVDQHQRTALPGVWAAGDVTNQGYPCVATAIAQGAVAAKSIMQELAAG